MDIPAGACHADNDSGDTLAMHRPGVAYEKRDGTYIAGRNAMAYYLRKNWKKIVLPCFLTILTSGAFALWQLGLLYALDAAVRLEQKDLMVWIGGELAVIALYYVLRALKRTVEVRAIRELSRQVQNDLALSMDAGLSRDAERSRLQRTLGGTVWESFFGCIGGVAGAVCNMAALLSLHWIILAAGLISTAAVLTLPRLLGRRPGRLGETGGIWAAGFVSSAMILFQMAAAAIPAMQGEAMLGAAGAAILTSGITSGLQSAAVCRASLASAGPCFARIAVRSGDA